MVYKLTVHIGSVNVVLTVSETFSSDFYLKLIFTKIPKRGNFMVEATEDQRVQVTTSGHTENRHAFMHM